MTNITVTNLQTFEVEEGRYAVPMSILAEYIEPFFEWVPWDCDTFTVQDVLAVEHGEECAEPYSFEVQNWTVGQTSYHIARVAYLVRFPDLPEECEHVPTFSIFDVEAGRHPLLDGNHRYAAAIVRDDDYFIVDIDGDVDEAERMFEMVQS